MCEPSQLSGPSLNTCEPSQLSGSSFPIKLMQILENNQLSDIIAWHPNGEGFIVNDKERLEAEVLPSFFKEAKYTSFNRRLKRWDFRIQRRGHKKSSYFHPLFFRNDYESLKRLHPLPQKTYHKTAKAAKAEEVIRAAAGCTIKSPPHTQMRPQATSNSRNHYGGSAKKAGMRVTRDAVQQENQGSRGLRQGSDMYHRTPGLDMIADGAASRPPFAGVSTTFQPPSRGQMMPALTAFDTHASHLGGSNMNSHLNQNSYMMPPAYQNESLPAPTMVSYSDSAVTMGSYPPLVSRPANYSFYAVPSRPQMASFAPPPAQMDYNTLPMTDIGTPSMLYYQSRMNPQLNGEMIGDQVSIRGAPYPYRNPTATSSHMNSSGMMVPGRGIPHSHGIREYQHANMRN